jgi:hypothetical protein
MQTMDASSPPAIVMTARDPEYRPHPISEWKLEDVGRATWIEKDRKSNPAPKQQATKKKDRALPVILIAIGGAVAGGFFGSTVQGSLCECDDQRITGAAYGALFGGAIAGIIAYSVLR